MMQWYELCFFLDIILMFTLTLDNSNFQEPKDDLLIEMLIGHVYLQYKNRRHGFI